VGSLVFANREGFRERLRDKCTRAFSTFEVSLGEQLCVGVEYRDPGYPQVDTQRTRGGHTLPGPQIPVDDRRAKAVIDLSMERARGSPVDGNHRHEGFGSFHHPFMLVAITIGRQVVVGANHFDRPARSKIAVPQRPNRLRKGSESHPQAPTPWISCGVSWGLTNFMRLSLEESRTRCAGWKRVQEIRVSRSFFARCGIPRVFP